MKNTYRNAIKMASLLTILGCVTLVNIQQAQATPITYTLTGTGLNGVLAGTSFSGKNFTFTGIGDTTATSLYLGIYPAVSLTSMTYDISGVTSGVATGTTPFFFLNATSTSPNNFAFIASSASIGEGFLMSGASSWDLISNIGPISSTYLSGGAGTPTDQGVFRMTGFGSGSFTAGAGASTAAPEPGTLALIAVGGMGIVSRLRLRRKG
jgi:hypothetical protein